MRRDAKGRFHSGRVCPPCLWNKAPDLCQGTVARPPHEVCFTMARKIKESANKRGPNSWHETCPQHDDSYCGCLPYKTKEAKE